MSKNKPIEKEVHLLSQVKTLDIMLFTAIKVIKNALPSTDNTEAIKNFVETFDIPDDDWDQKSMEVTYHRLNTRIKTTKLWQK